MNQSLITGFVGGCTAAALVTLAPRPEPSTPEPRVVVAECHNLQALDAEFSANFDAAKYALERLKAHCDAGSEAAVLMQVWEQDPAAGEVAEPEQP